MKFVSLFMCVVVGSGVAAEDTLEWWQNAHLYHVYPRSFKDSDGDGVGDLKGVAQKASHLKEIGVTAIWLSPIYESPMADFGYDISNFTRIDPTFGTLEDLKELIKTLKNLGIKLLLDLVPNHSSEQHEWFLKSVEGIPPYDDYYIWNDGKVDPETNQTVPINNWKGRFSGSMWEWNDKRKQFYLHQFLKEQVDLNYNNPAVLDEIEGVMKFWLDQGVDGFRVDAVPFLMEDPLWRDNPSVPGTSGENYYEQEHIYTENVDGTYVLCQRWAEFVVNYNKANGRKCALYLETYASIPDTMRYYGHGNQSLMIPFNFQLVTYGDERNRSQDMYDLIMTWMGSIEPDETPNWVIGNHDRNRVAKRYGSETVDAINLLSGVLPGVKVTYYGEEIGMSNTFVRWDQTVDNSAIVLGPFKYMTQDRDPVRTPMQWDDSVNAGFTSPNVTTWLPVNPDYWRVNVEAQKSAPVSHLKVFQALIEARADPVLQRGDFNMTCPDNDTLVVTRTYNGSWYKLFINFGSEVRYYDMSPDTNATVVTASINSGLSSGLNFPRDGVRFSLRPRAAVLLRSGDPTSQPNSAEFSHLAKSLSVVSCALAIIFIHITSLLYH